MKEKLKKISISKISYWKYFVSILSEKISNSRMDLIYKITLNFVKEFDTIYLEYLNVKGMMKNKKLSKVISDVACGKFNETLIYKAICNEKEVIHIDRFFRWNI